MKDNGEFYEVIDFNGWSYGTSMKQFYEDDVFIMTPSGIAHIKPEDRKNCFIIAFNIDESIRRDRLEARVMPGHSVEARLEADRRDFENFTDFDIVITDPNF